jgi:hypothetical protein
LLRDSSRTFQVIPLAEKGLLAVRASMHLLDPKPRYLSLLLLIVVKDWAKTLWITLILMTMCTMAGLEPLEDL